jgi:hypothetical protein
LYVGCAAWFLSLFKSVSAAENTLQVSSWFKHCEIPFDEIDGIDESIFLLSVIVHLKSPCRFGRTFWFMPKSPFLMFFRAHPVATQLQDMVRQHANPMGAI